jgi:hypothetical protein
MGEKRASKSRRELREEAAQRKQRRSRLARSSRILVVAVGLTLIVAWLLWDRSMPGDPLPPAAVTTPYPINDTDFFSGKSVGAGSPSVVYKGYRIGFCCNESLKKWEELSETRKDKFVRRYVE